MSHKNSSNAQSNNAHALSNDNHAAVKNGVKYLHIAFLQPEFDDTNFLFQINSLAQSDPYYPEPEEGFYDIYVLRFQYQFSKFWTKDMAGVLHRCWRSNNCYCSTASKFKLKVNGITLES